MHFKHKYITQPTLRPEDTIVKALNDLTNALKQKRNNKGIVQYEALQRIDKILINIPATEQQVPSMTSKQVIFDKIAKPPREIPEPNKLTNNKHPTPRVPNGIPTPRVKSPLPTITKAIVDKPIPNIPIKSKTHKAREEPLFEQTRLRQKSMNQKIAEFVSHSKLTCKSNSRSIPNVPNLFATTKQDSTSIIGI